MCIKLGENELSSVKGLMTMSLNAIISEVFNIELDDIKGELSLISDLGMVSGSKNELSAYIAEYFDGLIVDLDSISTLNDLFDVVIEKEFESFTV